MNNSKSKHETLGTGMTLKTSGVLRVFRRLTCLALLAAASNTELLAQYNGSFTDVQPVPGLEHPSSWEYISDISSDGLTIGIGSTRSGGRNWRNWDSYVATRNSVLDPFDAPVNLSALNRTGIDDGHPTFSSDGLTAYFHSSSADVGGKLGIWTATRETLDSDWGEPQFLVGRAGVPFVHPSLSNDDLTLYFSVAEESLHFDLFKMERTSPSAPFGEPQPLSALNTPSRAEFTARVSSDELALVYTNATNQFTDGKIMIATRPTRDDPFGEPVELDDFGLGSEINSSAGFTWQPVVSADWPADGSKIYYTGFDSVHGDWEIYEATWSVDQIGDFSADGSFDVDDLNRLTSAIRSGSTHRQYDLDQSGNVDLADREHWVTDLKSTWIGDANLDGEFNSTDFIDVFQAGKYETGEIAHWNEGDWNGDELFDSGDFIAAFQDGGYEMGVRAAVAAVPEPSSLLMILIGMLGVGRIRKR